jgi:hypothetical protein
MANRSRLAPQRRGYRIRTVLEATLGLAPPARRPRRANPDRRLAAAIALEAVEIDCDDLLDGRPNVQLVSRWYW